MSIITLWHFLKTPPRCITRAPSTGRTQRSTLLSLSKYSVSFRFPAPSQAPRRLQISTWRLYFAPSTVIPSFPFSRKTSKSMSRSWHSCERKSLRTRKILTARTWSTITCVASIVFSLCLPAAGLAAIRSYRRLKWPRKRRACGRSSWSALGSSWALGMADLTHTAASDSSLCFRKASTSRARASVKPSWSWP